jgi:hypothetical protein
MNARQKPVQQVVGVLDRLGIYAASGKREPWTIRFTLQPWKDADGESQKRPLVIQEKGVSDRKLSGLRRAFKPRDTLRVRVRLGKDRAELVKIVGKETGDSDLAAPAKKTQKNIWKHADLGTFKFDELGWTANLSLPAFRAFKYRSDGRGAGSSKTELRFLAEQPSDVPTARAVAVATKVIENQKSLVRKLKKSLFDDLHGRGPQSGMWWHGDIQTVLDSMADECGGRRSTSLKVPDDLDRLLGEPGIWIYPSVCGCDKPCAVINFEAPFEPEHGVGILTDGVRILGTGYQTDVGPFEKC